MQSLQFHTPDAASRRKAFAKMIADATHKNPDLNPMGVGDYAVHYTVTRGGFNWQAHASVESTLNGTVHASALVNYSDVDWSHRP